jgi:hypothetical protein
VKISQPGIFRVRGGGAIVMPDAAGCTSTTLI